MIPTFLRTRRSSASQLVVPFTGEGAYHGSTKPRPRTAPVVEPPIVEEMRATTLETLPPDGAVGSFQATFPNRWFVLEQLAVPSQTALQEEEVTFCWCPLELALQEAGPITHEVLVAMARHLEGTKRHVYIDSKLQYFEAGDVPVDSQHWHIDGSITARGPKVTALGHGVVHDMLARLEGPSRPPVYLTYQSSEHCATQFVSEPVTLELPTLIPNFDELDAKVRALAPARASQPAGAIVRFDGLSLHRAVAASSAGWRLWIRCVETDRETVLQSDILACYGTVFRLPAPG